MLRLVLLGLAASPINGVRRRTAALAAPNVDSAVGRRARLAGLATATLSFTAAAGLEAQLGHAPPLLACAPSALVAAWIAKRAVPSPALTPPLSIGDGVEVRPSPGRGEGLFAAGPIPRGTFVMDYLGEDFDEGSLAARYGTETREDSSETAYLLELNGVFGLEPAFVDAVDVTKSNAARYINHDSSPNLRKVKQRFPDRRLRFYANREIAPGEELLFDYGETYWTGREGELRESAS